MSDGFKQSYIATFRGHCFGIGLSRRGIKDNHVMFTILHEDDEYWWDEHDGFTTFSSGWHEDIPKVIAIAVKWCKEHCSPDIVNNHQYGWKFKS